MRHREGLSNCGWDRVWGCSEGSGSVFCRFRAAARGLKSGRVRGSPAVSALFSEVKNSSTSGSVWRAAHRRLAVVGCVGSGVGSSSNSGGRHPALSFPPTAMHLPLLVRIVSGLHLRVILLPQLIEKIGPGSVLKPRVKPASYPSPYPWLLPLSWPSFHPFLVEPGFPLHISQN
jgi:hypothetical protein